MEKKTKTHFIQLNSIQVRTHKQATIHSLWGQLFQPTIGRSFQQKTPHSILRSPTFGSPKSNPHRWISDAMSTPVLSGVSPFLGFLSFSKCQWISFLSETHWVGSWIFSDRIDLGSFVCICWHREPVPSLDSLGCARASLWYSSEATLWFRFCLRLLVISLSFPPGILLCEFVLEMNVGIEKI